MGAVTICSQYYTCKLCSLNSKLLKQIVKNNKIIFLLYGRVSIVLVRANARAILARSLQVADMQVDAMDC